MSRSPLKASSERVQLWIDYIKLFFITHLSISSNSFVQTYRYYLYTLNCLRRTGAVAESFNGTYLTNLALDSSGA